MWLAIAFACDPRHRAHVAARSATRRRSPACSSRRFARASVFLGKAAGVFAFVTAVECIVVPIVALLFHVELPDVAASLACVVVLGTVGVAAAGTLFGAMTVRTRARDLVLATVLFPLLAPTLVSGVAATREIVAMVQSMHPPGALEQIGEVRDYLVLLAVFDAVAVLGGVAFFGVLVDE